MSLIPGVGNEEEMNQHSNTPSPTISNTNARSKTRDDKVLDYFKY